MQMDWIEMNFITEINIFVFLSNKSKCKFAIEYL